jgi:hypothetical protein
MTRARVLVFGFTVGLLFALSPSCGAQQACGASSCGGCCDEQGQCVGGEAVAACGAGGVACNACNANELCQAGACSVDPSFSNGADAGAQPTNPLVFTSAITPNPAIVGTNALAVTLKGSNGVPVTGATMTAKTWMPAMGHGSPTPLVSELGDGAYSVSAVKFTMGGTWQVTLTATAAGGLTGSKVFNYTAN